MKIKHAESPKISLILIAALVCILLVSCAPKVVSTVEVPASSKAAAIDSVYSSYKYTTQEQLVKDTAQSIDDLGYNPHDSHYGELTCTNCHKDSSVSASELWCTTCHIGMEHPDGWTAAPISGFAEDTGQVEE